MQNILYNVPQDSLLLSSAGHIYAHALVEQPRGAVWTNPLDVPINHVGSFDENTGISCHFAFLPNDSGNHEEQST